MNSRGKVWTFMEDYTGHSKISKKRTYDNQEILENIFTEFRNETRLSTATDFIPYSTKESSLFEKDRETNKKI